MQNQRTKKIDKISKQISNHLSDIIQSDECFYTTKDIEKILKMTLESIKKHDCKISGKVNEYHKEYNQKNINKI